VCVGVCTVCVRVCVCVSMMLRLGVAHVGRLCITNYDNEHVFIVLVCVYILLMVLWCAHSNVLPCECVVCV